MLGLVSPEQQTRASELPANEQYIEARFVPTTAEIVSAVQTEPAEWHVKLRTGETAIVNTVEPPFEALATNIE